MNGAHRYTRLATHACRCTCSDAELHHRTSTHSHCPDFILLRVLSRNLVLWDSIEATEEWVQARIPDMIHVSLQGVAAGMLDEEVDIEEEDITSKPSSADVPPIVRSRDCDNH